MNMMKSYKIIIIISLLFVVMEGFAQYQQKMLMVEKVGKKKIIYTTQSHIKLKLLSGEKIEGSIFELNDSVMRVGNKMVVLNDISTIYVKARWTKLFSNILLIGGGGYIAVDALNNTINGTSPLVADQVLIVGTSALAAGLVLRLFTEKKLSMGRSWHLKVLEID